MRSKACHLDIKIYRSIYLLLRIYKVAERKSNGRALASKADLRTSRPDYTLRRPISTLIQYKANRDVTLPRISFDTRFQNILSVRMPTCRSCTWVILPCR